MAAEKVVDVKKDKKDKKSKDKSEKKEKKTVEAAGITKEKKDKKKDKVKQEKLARAVEAHLQAEETSDVEVKKEKKPKKEEIKDEKDVKIKVDPEDAIEIAESLVPFAFPLADDKTHKKLYKLIKKGAKLRSIHRGVKECEKAIKKCPVKTPASAPAAAPGLVIIAGDISPMDVIMHFPILCEEHNVPYIFVKSRAELGVAASTKRATSVVMLKPEGRPSKKDDTDKEDAEKSSAEEYLDSWKELVKTAQKQWDIQVQPWVKGIHPLQVAEQARLKALQKD
ncbi:snoRNA-binding protein [Podospora fimiseda]|uniref:SnoRNA-binding protein n=1 Tax=Podospora fimiseda TaxID=252190 RepID=A0AAN7BJI0_9PEZI|nr:snoRNA-binding protein [Podospora fimiseda]